MTDTQDRIVKGCKFIANIGSKKWDSDLTARSLDRLVCLINDELLERTGRTPKKPIDYAKLPQASDEELATPEFADKLFNSSVDKVLDKDYTEAS